MVNTVRWTRSERLAQIQTLKALGLTDQQVAADLGMSYGGVRNILNDPDGSKQRERRKRYQGTCSECGAPTHGSNGYKGQARRCQTCANKTVVDHGSYSMYTRHRCRCEACTEANARKQREYAAKCKSSGKFPSHGKTGYILGCRCDICREAWRKQMRTPAQKRYERRWRDRVRGTEPPEHGTRTAYIYYACRCDVCRESASQRSREYRAKRLAAT